MSYGCKMEQEAVPSPSLFGKKSAYDKAIQAVKEATEQDITMDVTYMDANCHGCLVGHILKVTDGLNYETYQKSLTIPNGTDYDGSLVKTLMNKHFDKDAFDLDVELSTIHDDYINDDISFESMKIEALACLESFRDHGEYGYESVRIEDDDDYYDNEEDEE